MRPKPALVFFAFCCVIALAWQGIPANVQGQDAGDGAEPQAGDADRAVSSLEFGNAFSDSARDAFEAQLTEEERDRLISLVSRSVLAQPSLPLPVETPRRTFYLKTRVPLSQALAGQLTEVGAYFEGYAYPNTHFLRARDAESLDAIGNLLLTHPDVAGTALQRPEDYCDPLAWADINDAANQGGAYRLMFRGEVTPAGVELLLNALGAVIMQATRGQDGGLDLETPFVDVLLNRASLVTLATSDVLSWIERTPVLVSHNADSTTLHVARAADIGPGTSYDLDGEGMVAGVWDAGRARDTHEQFQSAITPSPINNGAKRVLKVDGTSLHSHSTHVTGTIIGDGTGNAGARGYAPEACVASYDWNSMETERRTTRNIYRHVADNHSYGNGGGGYGGYDSSALASDVDIRDIFLNMCKSAGNDGSGSNTCTHDSCMKNSFTIAASGDTGTIAGFSSRGPTGDGRLMPHFTGNGEGLTSAYSSSDTVYASISGTSMSSPSVCGALVLLAELWQRENFNRQFAPDLARAVLAATCTDSYNTGPDYRFGFGLVHTRNAADLILADKASGGRNLVRGQIRQGEVLEWDLPVTSSATPLKVVCSWLDLAASTTASIKLVNDLDLTLIAPNGTTTHFPWKGLETTGTAGVQTHQWTRTSANRRDNIELVTVDSPAVGTWKVRVTGFSIPANVNVSGQTVPNAVVGFVLASERALTTSKVVVEDALNTGAAVSIPDNSTTGITRNLVVSGAGTIEQVRLHVDIRHPRRGDVRVRLRHPGGTDVIMNDLGASVRPDLIAVYPDTRQYAQDVTALVGLSVAGTWQVIVTDQVGGNTGSLRYLALEINNDPGAVNNPPTADAGADQIVNEGVTVNLTGAASTDPEGDTLTYAWVRLSGPAITINNPTSVTPNFTAPQVASQQTIVIQLTVDDGQGNQDTDTVSIVVNDVTVPNNPPNANAGVDFSTTEGTSANLNGTASTDPDADPLTYAWIELGTSLVTLQNPTSATPSFTAPMVTAATPITFQLTVSDGRGGVDTDTVVVTVLDSAVNNPPTADAGSNATVARGANVQLDGSLSLDPESDPLSFVWTQISGANTVTLSSPSSSIPTFAAPATDDVLVFELLVDDGNGNTDTDTVTITVSGGGGGNTGGSGGGGKSGGGGGCSTGTPESWLLLAALCGLTAALAARRRQRA